jgi:cytochrome c biogenesis protein CcmG/thiol:disulfide interchange protein DsbE
MNRRCLAILTLALTLTLALGLAACKSCSQPAGVGSAAPDFTVSDGSRTVALHDYKGKVVVLNFWATWCPPCVQEMPSLVDLQTKLKDKVTVLAVSVDVDAGGYQKFIRDHKVDLVTVRDADQKSNTLYGTYKFPETYIIDREGKIRRKFIGAVNWNDAEIENYLNGL